MEFDTVKNFLTYATKPDASNTDRRFLISGSVNTLISDADKIVTRLGYSIFGASGTSQVPVEGSHEWNTSTEEDRYLRSSGTVLEVYVQTVGAIEFNSWQTLMSALSSVQFSFDDYWDNVEKLDRLVFCNGTSNQYDWSGGLATYASSTSTTITIQGSQTAAQRRMLTAGTRQVRVRDSGGTWRTFSYTGGETSTTLTGVTPDPTAFTFVAGTLVMQEVITRANTPAAAYSADMLMVSANQVHVGSRSSRLVYVSENDSVSSFAFSSPRIAGEGALFTLDQSARAIRMFREYPIYFTSDYIYRVNFQEITVSDTLTESAICKRLKNAMRQGALSHDLSAEVENGIAYVSTGKELLVLEDVNVTDQPIINSYSDIIKPDFDALDFEGGHVFLRKNRLLISAPSDSRTYILETRTGVDDGGNTARRRFWQTPQILPVRRYAEIDGQLVGHSSEASESYLLFSGLRDRIDLAAEVDSNNGQPIIHRAWLAKYNGGARAQLKGSNEFFVEGAINPVTVVTASYIFEEAKGITEIVDKEISGSLDAITYDTDPPPSLGDGSLGDYTLSADDQPEPLPKFRIIHDLNPREYFDLAVRFESDGLDQAWELLCLGPNADVSETQASGNHGG